jgi:hypothetical protein
MTKTPLLSITISPTEKFPENSFVTREHLVIFKTLPRTRVKATGLGKKAHILLWTSIADLDQSTIASLLRIFGAKLTPALD